MINIAVGYTLATLLILASMIVLIYFCIRFRQNMKVFMEQRKANSICVKLKQQIQQLLGNKKENDITIAKLNNIICVDVKLRKILDLQTRVLDLEAQLRRKDEYMVKMLKKLKGETRHG